MPKGIYQRKHAWVQTPVEVMRAQVLRAAREILAAGEVISAQRLRAHGVRGASDRVAKIRAELVASGDLPPGAEARSYTKQLRVVSCQLSEKRKTAPSPPTTDNRQPTTDKPPLTRAHRRIRRLIWRYNSAAWRIFGRERARQIGAAP